VCEVPRSEVSREARKKGDGGWVVEIGANRQSCGPSGTLLLRLILEVVLGSSRTADAVDGKLPKAVLERLPQQP